MNGQKYKIQKIDIANFRGITDERTIDVAGKHLFLLGRNGYGKSTVVEAIRWCLFGSPSGQQEIEVRNKFYPSKTSEVILALAGNNKELNVRRDVNPGRSTSQQVITDKDGKKVAKNDAFPEITRMGSPTGTQVILAAQQSAGHRQADIQDFSKVLYFYLSIEKIPELIEKLRFIFEERRAERNSMSTSLDEFAKTLRDSLNTIQGMKNEIIKIRPWGEGSIPTRVETERKIDLLFHEMAHIVNEEPPLNLSYDKKLDKTQTWNKVFRARKQEQPKTTLDELHKKRNDALSIKETWQEADDTFSNTKTNIITLEMEVRNLLQEQTLEEVKVLLDNAEKKYDEDALRSDILRLFATYRDKYQLSQCPICSTPLATSRSAGNHSNDGDGSSALEVLRQKVTNIIKIIDELEKHRQSLPSIENNIGILTQAAQKITNKPDTTLQDVEQLIQQLDSDIRASEKQLNDAQADGDEEDRRIRNMIAEERFHYYQDQVAVIEKMLSEDLEVPRNALREYDSFLVTSEAIAKLILAAFDKQISTAVSPGSSLADKLTKIYRELTEHPSFDGVFIYKQPSVLEKLEIGKLELKVTSSKRPGELFPTNVLNGQAARALQLVPYFAFSDYWHDLMELDLLLVDDPSESFDTSHLENLMGVLRSVAPHTQIVMATHEGDRMLPLIEKYFPFDERCVITITAFDSFKGPTLEQR